MEVGGGAPKENAVKGLGPDGAGKAEVVGPALMPVLVLPNEKVGAFEVDEVGLAAGAAKEKVGAVGVCAIQISVRC